MSLRLQNQHLRLLVLLLAMGIPALLMGADLHRPYDPVVVRGDRMSAFLGADTGDVFVYAFKEGAWKPIPFQIDQVDKDSIGLDSYFALHNAVIDTSDELCFMAADMGDSVADNRWIADINSTLFQRYQIAAWDTSVVPARKAYAYVYRSAVLTPAFTPYMAYKKGAVGRSDTVRADSYIYGQNGDAIPDYLSLRSGESNGPDILDRWKIRFKGSIGPGFGLPSYIESEQSALRDTSLLVRKGPVRVLHRRVYELIWQGIDIGITLELESMFYPWSYKIDMVKESLPGYLGMTEMRQTVDYLPSVSGSLFHWSKGADILVDGVPDAFADKTFEVPGVNWYMVQGDFGSAATVFDLDSVPGTQLSLYYVDDSNKSHGVTRDGIGDTGDTLAYADSGVQLSALTQSIDISDQNLSATFYYLPAYHTAAWGDSLAVYTRSPLKVVVMPRTNTVIPVEMTALKASLVKGAVRLEWTTVTESNNYGFDVERRNAADAQWKKIGFLKGQGTSQTAHGYEFTDARPGTGTNYYRIKQIDLDGRATLSSEVTVEIQLPENLELGQNYPNPFNPGTDIAFKVPSGAQQRVSLAIYNLLGQRIATLVDQQLEPGTHYLHWDGRDDRGQNVVSGAYLYRLQMGQEILTRKMIKMQ